MNARQNGDSGALERSRDHWRLIAVGMICLVSGAILMAASRSGSSDSAHVVQDSPSLNKDAFVAVVLDPNKSSGRWASTLLAIKGGGDIFYLDTTRPDSNWAPYIYSPGFKNHR